MSCNHCNNLRRCEGGLKIGGRVTLTVVPPCPCVGNPRIPDNEDYWDNGITDPSSVGFYVALGIENRCFCSLESGTVEPLILGVTCDNFPIEDLTIQLLIQVWTLGFVAPLSTTYWLDGVIITQESFAADGPPTNGYSVLVSWNAGSLTTPFATPPIMNFHYKFDRP